MKTERMVLLVTPAEKAKIATEAGKLGVSAGEYIRKLVGLLDSDDVAAAEQLQFLVPELNAMADRWEATFADFKARDAERERERAYRASPEYREHIRAEVLADPTIDWNRVRRIFGRGSANEAAAE